MNYKLLKPAFLLFLLFMGKVHAQNLSDSVIFDASKQIEFISLFSQNDLYQQLLQSDKYFTNGFRVEYGGYLISKGISKYILPRYSKKSIDEFSVSFGQDMFTPEDLSTTAVDSTDRPYCGLLYLATTRQSGSFYKGRKLISKIYLGVVGPMAGGDEVQNWIHEVVPNNDPVNGWDNQIGNGLLLDYEVSYQQLIPMRYRYLESSFFAVAHVGTIYNYFNIGLKNKVGLFNSSYINFGGYRNRNTAQNQVFNIERTNRKGKVRSRTAYVNRKFQIFLVLDITLGYMPYDGTLEGSLIPFEDSPYVYTKDRVDPGTPAFTVGVVASYKSFQILYEGVRQRDVFKGEGLFGWGQIRLTLSL